MEKKIVTSLNNKSYIQTLCKAMSNSVRIDILHLLGVESLSVNEIANKLNLPLTTVASNINILEEAGLIKCTLQAGKHGSMKLCSIVCERIHINLLEPVAEDIFNTKIINIPLGSYFSVDVEPTCGMASENDYIDVDDEISSFYSHKRFDAQILWFYRGFIEYRIPLERNVSVSSIEISMELCSEAPNFRLDWPSDITLMINDVEVGTFTCPGDFGGRRGKFSPKWWPINSTQYGILKIWKVDSNGTTIDYKHLSNVKISDVIKNHKNPYLSFKIGIKKDAKNIGGINIFGEKFGDYPSGIVAKINYN